MRAGILSLALAVAAAGAFSSRSTTATSGDDAKRSPPGQQTTSLTDQTDLSVTVYNSDIALVRDVRNLTLPGGTFDLQFMDIAARFSVMAWLFSTKKVLAQPGGVKL